MTSRNQKDFYATPCCINWSSRSKNHFILISCCLNLVVGSDCYTFAFEILAEDIGIQSFLDSVGVLLELVPGRH